MKVIGSLMGFIENRIRGQRVLYIGVSDLQGGISVNAKRMQAVASEWHAIDFNPGLAQQYPELNILTLDLDDPIAARLPPVDFVVITEVLEHLRSPIQTLRNLGQQLPGARILGSVPNALSFGRISSALWSPRRYDVFDGHHLMVFNRYTLQKTLIAAGLTDLRIVAYDSWLPFRPFLCWRPDFAQGLYFEGTVPPAAN